jgi:hypothetical protein
VAIAWAAVSYAWGSVLARPMIERFGSGTLSGATMLIGGAALLLGSLGWEPNSTQSLEAFWGWPATLGWLFLLIFGSLIGYSQYMQLLRDLGPAKAGSFACFPDHCGTRGRHCCRRNCLCSERCWHGRHARCRRRLFIRSYGDALEAFFARIARDGTGVVQKTCSSSTLMR